MPQQPEMMRQSPAPSVNNATPDCHFCVIEWAWPGGEALASTGFASIYPETAEQTFGSWLTALEASEAVRVSEAISKALAERVSLIELSARRRTAAAAVVCLRIVPTYDKRGLVQRLISVHVAPRKEAAQDGFDTSADERIRLATLAARIGIFEWQLKSGRVVWSPGLDAIYGIESGSFGKSFEAWAALVVPEDVTRVRGQIEAALARGEQTIRFEFRVLRADRTSFWLGADARFDYDDAGKPVRMIGANFDIDERKRSESRDRLLVMLDDTMRPLSDPQQVVDAAARLLAEHLDADRCAYAEVDADRDTIRPRGGYTRQGPMAAAPFSLSRFRGPILDALAIDRPYVLRDAPREEPAMAAEARAMGVPICALIMVPLHKQGSLAAVLTLHSFSPRAWRDDEVHLVWTVANRCWESIERLRIARTLATATERLEAALSAGEVATFVWDLVHDRVETDRNFDRLHGVRHDPTAQRDSACYLARLHRDDVERVKTGIAAQLAGSGDEFRSNARVCHDDGTIGFIDVRGRIERDDTGKAVRMVGLVLDVTNQKVTERALVQSEARFRLLADTIPQLCWSADATGKLEWFNRRWYEYTGLDAQRAFGDVSYLIDPEYVDRVWETWNEGIGAGKAFEIEFPLMGRDGKYRMFLTRLEPLLDATGKPVRWFGTNTDVEERRLLLDAERAARAEAERLGQMKDEFLATLSHELRTPLNAILGWSQLLEQGRLAGDDARQAVQTIVQNARAQTRMIEDLLDMSRIISGKVQLDVRRMELAETIEAAVATMRPAAQAKQIALDALLTPNAGAVLGDSTRLQQVVWNLLNNAIKFTPAGGRVQVILERVGLFVEVNVIDSGIGIEPAFLPYVFDRFRQADASTTRAFGGLGLGLAIVKQIIELHGGSVRAHSAGPNQGSRFTFTLPVADSRAVAEIAPSKAPSHVPVPADLAGLTILVVEDDADTRRLLERILADRGAGVLLAASVDDAMAYLHHGSFDVVLSDIGMPERDGYDFIRDLRARPGPRLPAIAVTAFARDLDRDQTLAAGFDAHVAKPLDTAELVTTIRTLTGKK